MSAKDRLKASVVSDVLSNLPDEMSNEAVVADAIEAPMDRIMSVIAKRVEKAEKAARSHLAENEIQSQQLLRYEQVARTRDKQLKRAQGQVTTFNEELDLLADELEANGQPELGQRIRAIMTAAEIMDEDTPPTEVIP
jgi:hypothetical protein